MTKIVAVESLPCGCELSKDAAGGTVRYKPCLACALQNAGMMLQEAAQRIREMREKGLIQ